MNTGKILIVEDDTDLRKVYELILTRAGYRVSLASNGKEALDVLIAFSPDLILLDIFMPVMDGKAFLQNVDFTTYPAMKVVVCSNTSDDDLISDMMSLGALKVVTKSDLDPSGLTTLVAPYMASA